LRLKRSRLTPYDGTVHMPPRLQNMVKKDLLLAAGLPAKNITNL
jgi:hypothetical protein